MLTISGVALPAWLTVVGILVGAVLAAAIYFLPFIIGETRNVPHIGSIFVVNLFFGWSVIGWVIALDMAMRTKAPPVTPVPVPPPAGQPAAGWLNPGLWRRSERERDRRLLRH